jgi:hypothetical protein
MNKPPIGANLPNDFNVCEYISFNDTMYNEVEKTNTPMKIDKTDNRNIKFGCSFGELNLSFDIYAAKAKIPKALYMRYSVAVFQVPKYFNVTFFSRP